MAHKIPTTQTAATLTEIAKEIGDASAKLSAVVQAMQKHGVEKMGVPYWATLKKACDDIGTFVSGADDALRDARAARGDFGDAPKKSKRTNRKE